MSESLDEKPREAVAVPTAEARAAVLDALLMIDAPPIAPHAAPSEPVVAKPADAARVETKAARSKIAKAKPVESKSFESKSPEAKPEEAKSAPPATTETKPAEAKAIELKPSNTKSSEEKASEEKASKAAPAEASSLAAETKAVIPEPTPASKRFRETASTEMTAARERIVQRNLSGAMTVALAVGVLSAGVAGGAGYLAGLSEKTATHARAVELSVLRIEAEMSALRSEVERAGRAATASAEDTGERLDRVEKAQVEPLAKLSKLAEMIERIRSAQASMAASFKSETSEATGTVPPSQKSRPSNIVVAAWVLREFDKDVALIEGKRGLLEITLGDEVPGAGRVEGFRRHEGRWAVVTSRGLITSR